MPDRADRSPCRGRLVVIVLLAFSFLAAALAVFLVWRNLRNPEVRRKIETIYEQRTRLPVDSARSAISDSLR